MKLNELNKKYEGSALDMNKWKFSGMAPLGSLALSVRDVELDDGELYDFNALIALDGSAKPSDIALHGDYGSFDRLEKFSVSRNDVGWQIPELDERFIDALDTMIAPAFGWSHLQLPRPSCL